MDLQHRLAGDDFEVVDRLYGVRGLDLAAADVLVVAADVREDAGAHPDAPGATICSVTTRPSTRRAYCTSTTSAESSALTVTDLTSITSPSQRCSEPRTSSSVAEASSSLFGSKVSVSSPQPKSGSITRSPGAVNSTCSTMSRTWSSPSVSAARPSPAIAKG